MSDAAPEVKVKLVVDSNSGKVTQDMQKDLQSVNETAKNSKTSLGGMASGGMKASVVAMGMLYAELANKVRQYAGDALRAPIEAYMEQQKQVKLLASTFTMLDRGSNTMESIKELAAETESNMGALAMKTGAVGDELVAAFNNVIEKGGRSVEEAEALTEQMAYAARVVPGGLMAMSEGFERMQMGMVNARNPIVGLIAATHLLKGSARDVAKQMQHMSLEKQMALGEKAVAAMALKAKDLPMTFGQAANILGEVKENLMETAGGGLMKGLSKATIHFKEMFINGDGSATKLSNTLTTAAEWFGQTFMHVFEVGSSFVDGFVSGASIFSEEVSFIWKEIFGESDQTWKNMVEAGKLVGTLIGGWIKLFATVVGSVIVLLEKQIKYALDAVGLIAGLVGKVTGSKVVEDFGKKTQQKAFSSEQSDLLYKMSRHDGGDKSALQAQYIMNARHTGEEGISAKLQEAENQRNLTENAIANARMTANETNAKMFYENFAYASKVQDEAAMQNIASFMGNNLKMADAIGKLGPEVLGAAKDDFLKQLEKLGNSEAAEHVKKGGRADLKIGKTNITQNFNGGISIKQDFKDSDPDRIIVAFKQKLSSLGSNRLQSKNVGPFGA